jgi:hypothetical protein
MDDGTQTTYLCRHSYHSALESQVAWPTSWARMPPSSLVSLFRKGRFCRVGFGWIATSMTSTPQDPTMFRFSSSGRQFDSNHTTFQSMQQLVSKIQEPKFSRSSESLPPQSNTKTTISKPELAAGVCAEYPNLPVLKLPLSDECERGRMIMFLATECVPKEDSLVSSAVERYLRSKDRPEDATRLVLRSTILSHLRNATTPQYEEVLEYLLQNNAIDGMPFLVSLRDDLLQVLAWTRSIHEDDERLPHLKELDNYLRKLFCMWFSPSMLEIRRITYQDTAASIIERIATKEAVHPMQSLDDLRSRLGPDRRVFALFHPLLPNEPLVFVHVSLESEIPSSMQQVMETSKIDNVQVATFYSISNSQPGLAGVGLGQCLLKESIQVCR